MKVTKTIETFICDFEHSEETPAVGKVQPSGKDACVKHLAEMTKEIRLPDDLGGDMSGFKVAVDSGFKAKMKIIYKEEA